MISVAVCDDEPRMTEYLKTAVNDYFAKADIDGKVSVFNDGEPLAAAYASGSADFDIILLDITMKNCDGLTAAKKIREKDPNVMIVFVTASAEYVFRGYEVRAFRYLLKPELQNGFEGVFRDCVAQLTRSNEVRYSFQTGSENVSLPVKDIVCFESDRRKITVKCVNAREYSFYGKLDAVEEALRKSDFVRCHQSFLVNAKKITAVSSGELTMDDGSVIPVSKHRAKETNEAFLWAMR